jgi:hypothetical protein
MLFELCSLTVLFDILIRYVPKESSNIFPLTESTNITTVKRGILNPSGNIIFPEEAQMEIPREDKGQIKHLSAVTPAVVTSLESRENDFALLPLANEDGTSIWQGTTDIELFKVEYENANGDITVSGDGVDNLIAPGTSNEYTFTLKNTEDVSLDYMLEIKAYVKVDMDIEVKLPMYARMYDHDGNYMAGSKEKWADVLALDGVEKKGVLASDRFANYTIEWMWPYEGDDALDTFIGNIGAGPNDEDIDVTLVIEIKTYAQHSEDPDDPGDNPPPTGDSAVMPMFVAIIALVVAAAVIYYGKKYFDRSRMYD